MNNRSEDSHALLDILTSWYSHLFFTAWYRRRFQMTEASQLTKPRPTQQTAAGSPLYTNKLLQALAVTFQVSLFTYLRWKSTYHSTYLWILILIQVGLFLFIGPLSLAFFVYLCYTDYYLVSLCYLCWYFWDMPTSTNGGRSGSLVSWMRWITMYLCSIKFLL